MSGPLVFWPPTPGGSKRPLKFPPASAAPFKSRIWLPPSPGHSSKGREFPPEMVAGCGFPEVAGEYQSRPGHAFAKALLHQAGLHPAPPGKVGGRLGYNPIFRVNYPVMTRRYRAGKNPFQRPARVNSLLDDGR